MDLVFRALADPTRREIIDLLALRPRTVTEILRHFAFTQPALSKHLRILREAGVVDVDRDGRLRRYRLSDAALGDVAAWLTRHRRFWGERLEALAGVLDDVAAKEGVLP